MLCAGALRVNDASLTVRLDLRRLAADAERGRRREDASIIRIDNVEPVLVRADKVNRISTAKRHLRREFAKAAHGRGDQILGQRQPRPQSRFAVGLELIEEGGALGLGRLTLSQLAVKDLGSLDAADRAATHLALALGEGADAAALGL